MVGLLCMRRLAAHLAYRCSQTCVVPSSRRSIMRTGVPLAVLLAATASAAISPQLSLEEMVDRSPVIIEARIVRSRTAWDPAHKYIWTHYELQVTDTIRGSGSVTTVSEPGGSLDGISQAFTGSLGYSSGEHVFLFLFRTPIGYWRTTGGSHGKVTVDANGLIHSDIGNLARLSARSAPASPVEPRLRQADSIAFLSISDFKSLVRLLAQSRAAYESR